GPGAWAPKQRAGEQTFDINRSTTATIAARKGEITEVEPEAESLSFTRWARVSDQPWPHHDTFTDLDPSLTPGQAKTLRQVLWTGNTTNVRVATRFSLETVLRFTNQTNRSE